MSLEIRTFPNAFSVSDAGLEVELSGGFLYLSFDKETFVDDNLTRSEDLEYSFKRWVGKFAEEIKYNGDNSRMKIFLTARGFEEVHTQHTQGDGECSLSGDLSMTVWQHEDNLTGDWLNCYTDGVDGVIVLDEYEEELYEFRGGDYAVPMNTTVVPYPITIDGVMELNDLTDDQLVMIEYLRERWDGTWDSESLYRFDDDTDIVEDSLGQLPNGTPCVRVIISDGAENLRGGGIVSSAGHEVVVGFSPPSND